MSNVNLGSALRKSDYAIWEYESILSQKVLVSAGHRCMEAGGFHGHRWHRKAAECFMDVPTTGQQAAAFPAVRRLGFRLDNDGKTSPKHLLKDSRNTAAWVQTWDTVASSPCARCAQGCGPFETCVVLNRDRMQPISATCANCYFSGEEHVCSF